MKVSLSRPLSISETIKTKETQRTHWTKLCCVVLCVCIFSTNTASAHYIVCKFHYISCGRRKPRCSRCRRPPFDQWCCYRRRAKHNNFAQRTHAQKNTHTRESCAPSYFRTHQHIRTQISSVLQLCTCGTVWVFAPPSAAHFFIALARHICARLRHTAIAVSPPRARG